MAVMLPFNEGEKPSETFHFQRAIQDMNNLFMHFHLHKMRANVCSIIISLFLTDYSTE